MRCKIVRTQKLMWRNIMRSTKSQKASILHYSIDYSRQSQIYVHLFFLFLLFIIYFIIPQLQQRKDLNLTSSYKEISNCF